MTASVRFWPIAVISRFGEVTLLHVCRKHSLCKARKARSAIIPPVIHPQQLSGQHGALLPSAALEYPVARKSMNPPIATLTIAPR